MENINEIVKMLKEGAVILYPTDTIWGIGCDATNPQAVARIYDIKKREDSKALVLLAKDLDMVARYVKELPFMAADLVELNDKPMTIIYPGAIASKRPDAGEKAIIDKHFLAYNVVAEDCSVGIRIPNMDFCQQLLHKLGRPIVSTSANISGEPSPASFADISQEIISAVDYVVDRSFEQNLTSKASQIIKLELDGQVKIIRA